MFASPHTCSRPHSRRPRLEALEDRTTPAAPLPAGVPGAVPITGPADARVLTLSTDLNADGLPDLVVVSRADQKAWSYLRNTRTTFVPGPFRADASSGLSAPSAVIAVDVDGRYGLDLVFTCEGSNRLLVFRRLGNGTFDRTPDVFAVGDRPIDVVARDFDGDHLLDMAVLNAGSNDVSVLVGTFDGDDWTLVPTERLQTGGTCPVGLDVILTGPDGRTSLVVTHAQERSLVILEGLGNGTFRDDRPLYLRFTEVPASAPVVLFNGFVFYHTDSGTIREIDMHTGKDTLLHTDKEPIVALDVLVLRKGRPLLAFATLGGKVSILASIGGSRYGEVFATTVDGLVTSLRMVRHPETGTMEVHLTLFGQARPMVVHVDVDLVQVGPGAGQTFVDLGFLLGSDLRMPLLPGSPDPMVRSGLVPLAAFAPRPGARQELAASRDPGLVLATVLQTAPLAEERPVPEAKDQIETFSPLLVEQRTGLRTEFRPGGPHQDAGGQPPERNGVEAAVVVKPSNLDQFLMGVSEGLGRHVIAPAAALAPQEADGAGLARVEVATEEEEWNEQAGTKEGTSRPGLLLLGGLFGVALAGLGRSRFLRRFLPKAIRVLRAGDVQDVLQAHHPEASHVG